MRTLHRFIFPSKTKHAALEWPMEFDLHVNVGDFVEFEMIPGQNWLITRKKFKVLSDNTVEHVDYSTEPA
ncbi:hypothetical protein EIY72_21230 [Pseudomonas vancouverensis]|uniref:Uncharacterized protein n=1 Tax=Pseudomonas vancouverensis TaxID=95300 RepID=A0A4R4JVN8_PSEVA|nr:hypothetical protein F7R09_27595 [Pseudomonas vancouverensis]TDB58824.1 hypothetical protein EIY72_21230 [Pseudomonas vancouverensis]